MRYAKDDPDLALLIEAIIELCKSQGVSLSHEDGQGAFEFETWTPLHDDWLRAAFDARDPDSRNPSSLT